MKILHRDGQEEECILMCDMQSYPEYENQWRLHDKLEKHRPSNKELNASGSAIILNRMIKRVLRTNLMIDKYLLKDLPYSERISCVQVTRAGENQYVEVKNKYLIK